MKKCQKPVKDVHFLQLFNLSSSIQAILSIRFLMIVSILFATTLSSLCSTGSKDTSPWKRNSNSFAMDQIDVNDCNWPQHEWQHSVFDSNPNIGMLIKLGNETCSICTATIVGKSKMFGITAAHCFFNLHNNDD